MVDLDNHCSPPISEYPTSLPPSSASTLSLGAESGSALSVPRIRRKPMPRKGHKKSRNGCYSCKRRKVKCQENLPECYNCKRIGLKCEYPTPTRVSLPHPAAGASESAGKPTAPVHSHGSTSSFSMEDMRFFHHFLFTAYPPLPIGGSEVWKNVGALSHNYDFLMHAMLGLAASHLTLSTGVDYSSQALTHRISAINRLNEALSIPCSSRADGEARFAAALALTFQSSYMPDGMSDFVRMMRGCVVIAGSAMPDFDDSMFQIFSQENHIKQVHAILKQEGGEIPLVDAVAEEYLASVRKLAPLCVSVTGVGYLAAIERTIKVARSNPIEAQGEYVRLFTLSNYISNDEFTAFTDPNNHGAKLLLMHVYLCEYVLALTLRSPVLPHNDIRKQVVYHWVQRVVDSLPTEYKEYAEWSARFVKEYVWSPDSGSNIMGSRDTEECGSVGGLEEAVAAGIRYETESVGSGVMGSPPRIATGSPATSAESPSSGIGLGVIDLDLLSDVSSSGLGDSQGMLDPELSLESLIANPPPALEDWLSLAVAEANAQMHQMPGSTRDLGGRR